MAEEITVEQLLQSKGSKVYSIGPDATVYDALKVFSEAKIGALPVLEDGKLVGIFSERDYARKIILEGKASKDTPVREVMTTEVIHARPDEKVRKCLSLMTKHHFRHLPVLDEERLVGILSIEDVKGVT